MFFLKLFSLLCMLAAMLWILHSMWLRKSNHPSLEMKNWKTTLALSLMPWRYKNYWEKNGHKYFLAGQCTFMAGIVALLISQHL